MLNFGGTAAQLVSNEEFSWKKETFGPLLNNNKNKWRNALPDSEVALTEICCKEAFQVGGYITEGLFESLSFKDKVWVILGMTAIFSVDLILRTV